MVDGKMDGDTEKSVTLGTSDGSTGLSLGNLAVGSLSFSFYGKIVLTIISKITVFKREYLPVKLFLS